MTRPTEAGFAAVKVVAACVLFVTSPATAQSFIWFEDFSAGIGGVVDGPAELVIVGGIGIGVLSIEAEFGALSAADRCRQAAEPPDNCYDSMVAIGVRRRFRPETARVRPFVNLLGGTYASGTGEEGTEFRFEYGALQVGGGVDLRPSGSRHGIRLSVNFRRVYTEPRRHQVRVLVAYGTVAVR